MEAIADPPVHERGAVRHDDIVRDLVHRLKYGDRLDLATSMGQWMARAGRKLLIDADAPPEGPAARRSRWTGGGCGRRFNQASAPARAVASDSRVPVLATVLATVLRRVRATSQQWSVAQCAGHERARRIRGDPGRQGCHPRYAARSR